MLITRELLNKKKIITKIFKFIIFNEICQIIFENVIE